MPKSLKSRYFRKFTQKLLIIAIILPLCVPAHAEISPEILALSEQVADASADGMTLGTFFAAWKAMKLLGDGTKTLPELGILGGTLAVAGAAGTALFIESSLNTANAFDGAFAARDIEDNLEIEEYYEALWGNFLNDPLYMRPRENDPNTTYIRDVFNKATVLVKQILLESKLDLNFTPQRVFLSETLKPHYQIHGGHPDFVNGDIDFFVPATAFFVGTKIEKMQKVALVLLSQIAAILYDQKVGNVHKEISKIMNCYKRNGAPMPFCYSSEGMIFDDALKLWSANKLWKTNQLSLSMTEVLKKEFDAFDEDYAKYKDESDPRSVFKRPFGSIEDFERQFLSFRAQAITTVKGPKTGPVGLSPCTLTGQEFVIGHDIPRCLTIHLKDIADEHVIKVVDDTIKAQKKKESTGAGAELFKNVSGIVFSLVGAAGIGRALRLPSLAKFATTRKAGFVKIIVPFGSYFVGTDSADLLLHAGPNHGKFSKLDETKLKASLTDLEDYENYLGPNAKNNPGTLKDDMNALFRGIDPTTVNTMLRLAK